MPGDQAVQMVGATRLPKEFNPDVPNRQKEWEKWKQQFTWYANGSGLSKQEEVVRVSCLMNALGDACADIYNSFEFAGADKDKYDAIIKKFDEFFINVEDKNLYRHRFFEVMQLPDQNVADYLVKLKLAAKGCAFETMESDMILLQLQKGVHNQQMREKVMSCKTLEEAKKSCQEFELLNEKKQQLSAVNQEKTVDAVHKQKQQMIDCKNCGSKHTKKKCKAFGKTCNACKKPNHFAKVCRSKGKAEKEAKTDSLETPEKGKIPDQVEKSGELEFHLHALSNQKSDAWYENIKISDQIVRFKLDPGSDANCISLKEAGKLNVKLKPSKYKFLLPYGNEKLKVEGEFDVKCTVMSTKVERIITILVVNKDVIPIMDRDTCEALNLVQRIHSLKIQEEIFEGLGCLKNFEYEVEFEQDPQFTIKPIRPVPHKISAKVKQELERMEKLQVIRKVETPTPVVSNMIIVSKGDSIRVCLDPSEVNRYLKRRHFKLKNIDEIAARIKNSKCFTVLDMKKGFWQLRVHADSQKFFTMGTPWGRYSYERCPFGAASIPEIFQDKISSLFKDFENVEVSMDDILIHAETMEKLAATTQKVMEQLYDHGLRLNKDKCQFNKTKVKFLGCFVTKDGIQVDESKIEAIKNLKVPVDRKQLSRLLGMLNYLSKYISNLSELTEPLRLINTPKAEFIWADEQQNAFTKIREVLSSLPVLRYYDVNAPVTVSVDASQGNVGAVLLQNNQPVAYASKALTKSQRNYPQIEKECFAIRYGLTKFHDYVYGKEVLVETDHKPLEAIFKKTLDHAPARLRRLIFDCLMYNPKVTYKKGTDIPIADLLSRDIDNDTPTEEDDNVHVNLILKLTQAWKDDLEQATGEDKILKKLKHVIMIGFPNDKKELDHELNEFWNFRDELSTYEGLIFKGDQILIPEKYRNKVLEQVHEGHLSSTSCINRARQTVFWISMAKDIQTFVESCQTCQKFMKSNTKEPMIVAEVPEYPFQKVASDLFHYNNKEYVLLVDNYSNWFDFAELKNTSSGEVIKQLKRWFCLFGEPDEVYSDGGPQYSSKEFKQFAKEWNFAHHMSSPHYPKSNGLAERYVQVAKNILKKNPNNIEKSLMAFRNTPRENMGSPNQRLMSRAVKTSLPTTFEQLKPKIIENVTENLKKSREKSKKHYDKISKFKKKPDIGEEVLVQHPKTKLWTEAKVMAHDAHPRSVIIKSGEGTYRRNTSFIRKLKKQSKVHINVPEKTVENKFEKKGERPEVPVIFNKVPPQNNEEEEDEDQSYLSDLYTSVVTELSNQSLSDLSDFIGFGIEEIERAEAKRNIAEVTEQEEEYQENQPQDRPSIIVTKSGRHSKPPERYGH